MGIVPILFSAAGAEVFSFVISPPICMICLASQRKKAPMVYDTTICCKIQEKRKSSYYLALRTGNENCILEIIRKTGK